MAIVCPSCGQENPEGFRLCGMCGSPLAAEPEAREERKVVTVLFCDLVGSTAQAEGLDPEDVRSLLSRFHSQVRAELERYGGTVEKFIGDAVMALFGAPVAHEDDPERAVRAALAIRDFARAEGTELRIGITTGEALIALRSRPSEGEGMASGDVVNTAARLQTAAPVNGIVVGSATYRSTRHVITYRELPAVQAKGKAEPIPIWEAVEGTSRFGVDVEHHAHTQLVGRERELSVLRDALDRARQERIPQLVTLVGVPGMGKSRLVYELSRIADADPELITWRQGRCIAYGDGVAFWALAEVVKAQAGILEQDSKTEAAEKLRAAVDDALADENDARWVESHLRPLVGLETEAGLGGDRRGEAFAAWRRFLEALAEQRALVLVFEDLHWADEGLLDFIDELIDWLSGVRILVVCSARPELLERRPGWGGGKLNASTLGLSPLSTEQTAALISHSLERSVLPAAIQQALLERAEGNPLYAEQFAQLYLERGSAEDLPLPETLQGIVAARLDGLSPEAKALLQDAAVIGKVFWTGALRRDEREAAPLLHALERNGFLTRQRRSSVESEGEWAFAHMLLRDVAYGQIPRGTRSHKHRQTAEWIEGLGRSDDHAELLAYHWSSALELAKAAGQDVGDLATPTRLALRAAGDRAFSVNAYPAAATYYVDALALGPKEDRERPQLLYRLADALFLAGDERMEAALEEARDALLGAGDRETAAGAEVSLSRMWWERGQNDKASGHEARAEELVGAERSLAAARVLAFLARTRTIGGDPTEGLRLATEAMALAEALKVEELQAHSLATIGLAKVYMGDPSGEQDEVRALEIAMAVSSPVAGSIANNVAVHAVFSFEFRRAAELYGEGLRIAERLGDASGARWLRAQVGQITLTLGRWDESLQLLDEFVRECEAGSPHYMEGTARRERARIREARGDLAGALADYERALSLARSVNDPQELLPNLAALCSAFEMRGHMAEARDLARELITVARSHPQDAVWGLSLDFVFTRVALEHEEELRDILRDAPLPPWKALDLACLDRDFVRAAEMWSKGGSPTWEARLRLQAAEELIEAGRQTEGVEQLEKALDFYRSVGATFYINHAEELLAKTA
ncbi:MAG: AAA family ATPase [Actinomycetota bacterium]|nr:AAA family ATPase [Actinomycetota bacterium]